MSSAGSNSEVVLALAEEFLERYRQGERPSLKTYIDRHPELAAEIRDVFPAMAMMENIALDDESLEGKPAAPASECAPLEQLGDFRIIRTVGQGGMGVVYEAEQVSLGRHVALKLLTQRMLVDGKHKLRFEREARAAAKLHHTNIVPVFGVGEHDGVPYYVMQFIQGLGLDEVLDELKRMQAAGTAPASFAGGELRVSRRDVSVADMARSLVTGEFQLAQTNDSDAEAEQVAATATLDEALVAGAVPARGTVKGESRLSDSFAGSSSSVVLPGQSRERNKSKAKRQTYWQSVAQIGVQVADALEYAHKQGILHRDIKPSNLLLDTQGTVWVTDFGLAKADDQQNLTHAGDILGTLRYMPPEAFDGRTDPRSDVYALGQTLYELLAFRPAFDEKERNRLIKQVTTAEPARLDRLNREVPRDLVTIVHKAIERDLARRYPTAGALAADLQRFLDDEPIQARRQTQLERYVRWARHHPGIAVLGALLTAVLVAATVASLVVAGRMTALARSEADAAAEERTARKEAEDARERESQQRNRAEKARTEADENRNLLRVERDQAQQNLYFAEMTLAGIAAETPAGLGRVGELLARWGPAAPGADLRGWEWHYLDSLTRHATLTLHGHVGPVNAVAYTRDGKRLATGGNDKTVRIWDAATGREIARIRGHTNSVLGVAWSPDGARLATASLDGTARIWDGTSGQVLRQLCGPGAPVTAVAWRPDGARLATTGYDFRVRVWDADTGREVIGPKLGAYWGLAVAWSPDGKRLAAGTWNPVASIVDGETGTVLASLKGHSDGVRGLNWSPAGDQLATAAHDGTVRVWDPNTGKEMAVLQQAAAGYLSAVCWSPDGKQIAAGGGNRAVQVWNAQTGQARAVLRGGNLSAIPALAWSPDGESVAATSVEGVICAWHVGPGSALVPGSAREGTAETGFDWARDGRTVTRDGEATVRVWAPARDKPSLTFRATKPATNDKKWLTNRVQFSPNGTKIAAGGDDQLVRIWDAASGDLLRTLNAPGILFNIRWNPDGTRIACSGWGFALAVWDVRTWERVLVTNDLGMHHGLAWSPSGNRIATAGFETPIRVWDPASGRMLVEARPNDAEVRDVTWSPDGRRIASSGSNGMGRIWDAATGAEVLSLRGHSGEVLSIGWSPDGNRIATGSGDRTVKLWDPASGQETLTLRGHADMVTGVHWHPDGCRLATRDGRGNVLIWDATPGFLGERSATTLPGLGERIRRDPADTTARRLRAEVLARRGDWDAAAVDFAELARLSASAAAVYPAGWWALARPEDRPAPFPPPAGAATARWLAPADDPNGFVSLPTDGTTAVSRVFAPQRIMVVLDIGPVTPGRLWLNEKAIGAAGPRPILVEMREGWNSLSVRGGPSERFVRWRAFDKPADNAERLTFAQIAYDWKRFAVATRFWAEALESDPKLGDDRQAQHRYNAARAAALAAAGQGKDEPPLDDAAKAKLRGQALDWLKAELTVWGKLLESGPHQARPTIVQTLSHWEKDTDLASIRDAAALAKLPADEQKAFSQLWADVAALLKKAEEKPK
jgi:WD40 repeat protein/serine/threonine protein kinase